MSLVPIPPTINERIAAYVASQGQVTAQQIGVAFGQTTKSARRRLSQLQKAGAVRVAVPLCKRPGMLAPAIWMLGKQPAYIKDQDPMVQRWCGANSWVKGRAGRDGLVAALFGRSRADGEPP